MKFGFGAATVASLSLSLSVVSSPAASQTTNCAELRAQERSAVQNLSATQTALALYNYDFKKDRLQQWFNDTISRCERNSPGMDVECKQETEEYYNYELQILDDDKAALEAEVSAAEGEVIALNQQLADAHC